MIIMVSFTLLFIASKEANSLAERFPWQDCDVIENTYAYEAELYADRSHSEFVRNDDLEK